MDANEIVLECCGVQITRFDARLLEIVGRQPNQCSEILKPNHPAFPIAYRKGILRPANIMAIFSESVPGCAVTDFGRHVLKLLEEQKAAVTADTQ